jgi:hypothetical protein
MLLDVITRVSSDTGIHVEQKRTSLIELLNQSAKEMYRELECNKIKREVTLVVPGNKVVSLPSFVGELRGMRAHTNEMPFDLHSIGSPRYVSNTLGYKFKNWRDLGESAVHTLPTEIGPLNISTNVVETEPTVVLIDGQTDKASRIQESVTLSANSIDTTNLFGPSIYSIATATRLRQSDITVKDVNDAEIAVLYNTDTKTRYKLCDVSQVCWSQDTTNSESLIDVLYKVQVINLVRDSDSFYAGDDYDEAWYNMCMFFFLKPLQNRLQDAMAHRAASLDFLRSAKDSGETGIMKRISFGRNKFHNLFSPYCCSSDMD